MHTKTVELEDGWSLIPTKARTKIIPKSRSKPKRKGQAQPSLKNENLQDGTPPTELQVSRLLAKAQEHCRVWERDPTREKLADVLRALAEDSHVENAICIGLGSFDPDAGANVSPVIINLRLRQLAIFLDVVRILEALEGTKINTTAQDPNFTSVDKAVLDHFGIRLEAARLKPDDPRPSDVGERTFIYAPFFPWPTLLRVILPTDPKARLLPLYIGTPITGASESIERTMIDPKRRVVASNLAAREFEGQIVQPDELAAMWEVTSRVFDQLKCVFTFEDDFSPLRACEIWTRKFERSAE